MWTAEHEKSVTEFLTQDATRRLIVFIDSVPSLRIQFALTADVAGHILYFVKTLHRPNVPQYILLFIFPLFNLMNDSYSIWNNESQCCGQLVQRVEWSIHSHAS